MDQAGRRNITKCGTLGQTVQVRHWNRHDVRCFIFACPNRHAQSGHACHGATYIRTHSMSAHHVAVHVRNIHLSKFNQSAI